MRKPSWEGLPVASLHLLGRGEGVGLLDDLVVQADHGGTLIDGEDGGPPVGVVRAVLVRKDKGVQAHPDPGVGGRMSNGARQGDMEPNAMRSAAPLVMAALLMRDVRSIACILDLKA